MALDLMPHFDVIIFILSLLLVVAFILRADIVVLARMNEIFHVFLIIIFTLITTFLLTEIDFKNFLPLTYKDISPVFEGSTIITGIWSFIIVPFLFGDRISNKNKIKKTGLKTFVFLLITIFTITSPLGVFGWSIVNKMPLSLYTAIKQISLFGIFTRFELVQIVLVICSDFILISLFSFTALHILKLVFHASNTKPLINIYMLLIFFLSLIIARNFFELEVLSKKVISYPNIFMGLILPVFIFLVGKARRKV